MRTAEEIAANVQGVTVEQVRGVLAHLEAHPLTADEREALGVADGGGTATTDDFTGEGSCPEEDDYLRAQASRHDWRDDNIVLGVGAERFCWTCLHVESSEAGQRPCEGPPTFDAYATGVGPR